MDWSEFERFSDISEKYMPIKGEGDTMASQIVTACNKLVYRWYNDGDVFDNRYYLSGYEDISSYANWLYEYAEHADEILLEIKEITSEDEYEQLLYELCLALLNETYLDTYSNKDKIGSIYDCDGEFMLDDSYEYDDDDFNW